MKERRIAASRNWSERITAGTFPPTSDGSRTPGAGASSTNGMAVSRRATMSAGHLSGGSPPTHPGHLVRRLRVRDYFGVPTESRSRGFSPAPANFLVDDELGHHEIGIESLAAQRRPRLVGLPRARHAVAVEQRDVRPVRGIVGPDCGNAEAP